MENPMEKFKDNLTKLESRTDSFLRRLADSSYSVASIVVAVVIALIAWAWW